MHVHVSCCAWCRYNVCYDHDVTVTCRTRRQEMMDLHHHLQIDRDRWLTNTQQTHTENTPEIDR